jgi:CrcB protein
MNSAWIQALAVAGGAAAGGLLRWRVGVWLAAQAGAFPLGTLMVNLAGGLAMGALLAVFERQPQEVWRLLLVTGFLGGLTTFSAFSGESLQLLLRGQWGWAVAHTLAHVLGALAFAALGWCLVRMALA